MWFQVIHLWGTIDILSCSRFLHKGTKISNRNKMLSQTWNCRCKLVDVFGQVIELCDVSFCPNLPQQKYFSSKTPKTSKSWCRCGKPLCSSSATFAPDGFQWVFSSLFHNMYILLIHTLLAKWPVIKIEQVKRLCTMRVPFTSLIVLLF